MKNLTRIISLTIIAVMCVVMFASCGAPASDPDKAIKSLKDEGYVAAVDKVIIPIALKATGVANIKEVVSGTKTADGKLNTIVIVYFESNSDAKEAWSKVKEYADGQSKGNSDWVCDKSGAMIWFGTKDAVKAAK